MVRHTVLTCIADDNPYGEQSREDWLLPSAYCSTFHSDLSEEWLQFDSRHFRFYLFDCGRGRETSGRIQDLG